MGGKYEIRWKFNSKCPCWDCEFTDDLETAYTFYSQAVNRGYSDVELIMHDWKDCPADCAERGVMCTGGDAE